MSSDTVLNVSKDRDTLVISSCLPAPFHLLVCTLATGKVLMTEVYPPGDYKSQRGFGNTNIKDGSMELIMRCKIIKINEICAAVGGHDYVLTVFT